MTNPFEVHGIKHLSPSSCNLFAGSPAMFVLEKCLKRKGQVGAAAFRGNAVESGIVLGLTTGANESACVEMAKEEFWRLSALSSDPRREKEEAAVADMVKIGLKELMPYGPPSSVQGKIDYKVEGLQVPLVGYYDIEWQNHKILLDIKTTHALPSAIKLNHARQVALYIKATGGDMEPRLTYITSKKCSTYKLENVDEHIKAVEKIALTIQRFLSISTDPMELAMMTIPDIDTFYFSDPGTRQAAFEIWGL